MNNQIRNEQKIHGDQWNAVHGGYFSDPHASAPLVKQILRYFTRVRTIIDLGGGNGSVLNHLSNAGISDNIKLFNLDDSSAQLDSARKAGLRCIHGCVDKFLREDIPNPDHRTLFMMRSVLHYFGQNGLLATLQHLRSQMKSNEIFIHQTASFQRQTDAETINTIYQIMGTEKWYPTIDELRESLNLTGWRILDILPAPSLEMTSEELIYRYDLNSDQVQEINTFLRKSPALSKDLVYQSDDQFRISLHYWIYVCQAH